MNISLARRALRTGLEEQTFRPRPFVRLVEQVPLWLDDVSVKRNSRIAYHKIVKVRRLGRHGGRAQFRTHSSNQLAPAGKRSASNDVLRINSGRYEWVPEFGGDGWIRKTHLTEAQADLAHRLLSE